MNESATLPKSQWGPLTPLQITAIYALVGALWIPITDHLMVAWIGDVSMLALLQTLKGGVFVLITAALLYLLIHRSMRLLREEHAQLKAVIEGTPDAIFIKDTQGRYVLMNSAGARHLGKSVVEVLGRQAAALLPSDTAGELLKEDRQVITDGEAKTFEHAFTVAGITRIFSCTKAPYRDAEGRINGVIGIARDITEGKLTEEALRESRERYRSLIDVIDTSPVGIFILDSAFRVMWANLTLERYFGLSREAMIGQDKQRLIQEKIKGLFEDPEGFSERVSNTYAGNSYVEHFECHVLKNDKCQERWLEHRSQPIRTGLYARGRIEQYYDITERKLQKSLLSGEKRILEMIAIDAVLPEVLNAIALLFEAQSREKASCSLCLLDAEGHRLRYGAGPSLPESYVRAIDGMAIGPAAGSCGTAAYKGERVVVTDIATDPLWKDYRDVALRHGLRACWSVPIFSSQRNVLGTFAIYHTEPRGPSGADLEFIDRASHLAGIAIERKQAKEALQRAKDELERRVDERTAELANTNTKLRQEIAGRKQTEAVLRESEERFRQLVEHIDEIFWVSNADGSQVLYVSPAYEKVRGHPCQRVYEHPTDWLEAIHPEDRARLPDIHAQIATTGECNTEYRIIRPDGTVRWIWSRGFAIRDAAGRIQRIAGIGQDITKRKQTEEKVRRQQAELTHLGRFALAGEMASGLAHELNQPLAAIATYTGLCLRVVRSEQINSEVLAKTLEKTVSQAQRAGEIIRRLRNLVRKTEPKRSKCRVNELIRDIMPLIEPEACQQGVQICLELDETLPSLFADSIQIQQVVLNLVGNAIEAMSESRTQPRAVTICTVPAGSDALEITVSDTGPGLSPEAMERLFMPFFTTKTSGMGLGLSLSKSIIEAHGGNLWATSNSDGGVTFHFTLPYELRKMSR